MPDRNDFLNLLDGYMGEPVPATLTRITSLLRAAWPLCSPATATQIALAFCDGDGTENPFRPLITSGRDWLQLVESSFETSRE